MTPKAERGGRRYAPYAFTEQGVAMLSSVLKSSRAIPVNIEIMRAFVRMRELLASNKELAQQLAEGPPPRLRPDASPHALRIPDHSGHPAPPVSLNVKRQVRLGFRLRARVGFSTLHLLRPARFGPAFGYIASRFGCRLRDRMMSAVSADAASTEERGMLLRVLAIAVGAGLAFAQAGAMPLSSSELATLRETDVRYTNGMPSEAATELARKIGREANIDGLRSIIELHRPELLRSAARSYDSSASRSLPKSLEELIVAHYKDRDAHSLLFGLIGRNLDQDGRYPQYRSRELFDLLYADVQGNRNESYGYAIRLVATDLKGIESELVSILSAVPKESAVELVTLLGQRRYPGAVPALRALQRGTPFAKNVNDLLGGIDRALLRIGTADAVQAVLDRLTELGRQTQEPQAEWEMVGIVNDVRALGGGTQADYPALRAALPKTLSPKVQGAVVQMIASRRETRGLPELITATGQGDEEALTALLALGSEDDWRAGATQLGQIASSTAIKPEHLALLRKRLDAALADPVRIMAERREAERKQAFIEQQRRLNAEIQAAATRRDSDPKRYAAETEKALQSAEKVIEANAGFLEAAAYTRDTLKAYGHLATYTRFTLRNPRHAVILYERAITLSKGLPARDNPGLAELIGLADCLRFDLKHTRKAQLTYEQVLQQVEGKVPSTNDVEAVVNRLLIEWASAEIAFLSKGNRYANVPDSDTLGAIAFVLAYGASSLQQDDSRLAALTTALRGRTPGEEEARAFAQQLEALSPSQARLLGTFNFLPLMRSPEQIVKFLRKNDPAGFLTASLFGVWRHIDQTAAGSNTYQAASGTSLIPLSAGDSELMRRAEILALGAQATIVSASDSNLASPEITWQTFFRALSRADLDAAWKCTTPGLRNKFETSFRAMTPEQLEKMAESLTGFERSAEFGEFVEAVVVRADGFAGAVTFVKQGIEWRITEM